MSLEYKDGKVWASPKDVAEIVQRSGLRSKRRRKIMKRFKLVITKILEDYVESAKVS